MPGPNKKKIKQKKKATNFDLPEKNPAPSLDQITSFESTNSKPPPSTPAAKYSDAPFIDDRWNGPRATDIGAFVSSPYAAPPSLSDAYCAMFATPEIREMLVQILPPETALVGSSVFHESDKRPRLFEPRSYGTTRAGQVHAFALHAADSTLSVISSCPTSSMTRVDLARSTSIRGMLARKLSAAFV